MKLRRDITDFHSGMVWFGIRQRFFSGRPGKFLSHMQSDLPVLTSINPGNDLAELIESETVGRVASPLLILRSIAAPAGAGATLCCMSVYFDPPKGEELKVGSEILKRRPAVVISHNAINRARRTVMVVPLSSSPMPVEIFAVPVPSAGTNSVAVCDQVTTINKATRMLNRIGTMAQSDFKLVENGVKEALGFAVS